MLTVEFDRLQLFPGARILDLGCGSGRHAAAAFEVQKARVVAVDREWTALRESRRRRRLHLELGCHGNGRWDLARADAIRLPFDEAAFDLVVCAEVLEHIPRHEAALAEAVRVLKPDGTLALSVPRAYPERICWKLSPAYRRATGGHVRIYRRRSLLHLIENSGLRVWRVHYAHSLHTPFWWLKCLVGPANERCPVVRLYHRFLVWDLMRKPAPVRFFERLLNAPLGKSLVVYCTKVA
jgi:SAM-dependent methyltransferase